MAQGAFYAQRERYRSTCFLCGTCPSEMTEEHVVPAWLLKRWGLQTSKALLPNGSPLAYAQRTVPACARCNSLMGSKLEQPIAGAMRSSALQERSLAPVVRMWLTKIVIGSMHCQAGLRDDLRDANSLPQTDLDETMSDTEPLRLVLMNYLDGSRRGGPPQDQGGTLLVFQTGTSGNAQSDFDLLVHPRYQMIAVRAGNQALVHVLGDDEFAAAQLAACGLLDHFQQLVLNPIQFRDVYATCAALRWATPIFSFQGFDSREQGANLIASPLPDENRPYIQPEAFLELRHKLFSEAITQSYGLLVPPLGFCTTYSASGGRRQSTCFFYACPTALETINMVPPFDCPVCGASSRTSGLQPDLGDIFQLLMHLDGQEVPSRSALPPEQTRSRKGTRREDSYGRAYWRENARSLLQVPFR